VERGVLHSIDALLVECNCVRLQTKEANNMKQEVCET